jgi:hypothetical protein
MLGFSGNVRRKAVPGTSRMAGPTECACGCPECFDGECEDCSNPNCMDANCAPCRARRSLPLSERMERDRLRAAAEAQERLARRPLGL